VKATGGYPLKIISIFVFLTSSILTPEKYPDSPAAEPVELVWLVGKLF